MIFSYTTNIHRWMMLPVLFLFSLQIGSAQRDIERLPFPEYRNLNLGVAYFGEHTFNPGIMISLERAKGAYTKNETLRNGKAKTTWSSWFEGVHLGIYRDPNNHTGLLLSYRGGYRWIGAKGWSFEIAPGLGYFHQILDNTTYEVTAARQVIDRGTSQQGGFAPSLALGFGRDNFGRSGKNTAWFVRANYFAQIPHNTLLLFRSNVEIGIRRRLNRPATY